VEGPQNGDKILCIYLYIIYISYIYIYIDETHIENWYHIPESKTTREFCMFDPGLTLGQDHTDWRFLLPQLTLENVANDVANYVAR